MNCSDEWRNIDDCILDQPIEGCGSGNQTQEPLFCEDGTVDKCSTCCLNRIVNCSFAGTELPCTTTPPPTATTISPGYFENLNVKLLFSHRSLF